MQHYSSHETILCYVCTECSMALHHLLLTLGCKSKRGILLRVSLACELANIELLHKPSDFLPNVYLVSVIFMTVLVILKLEYSRRTTKPPRHHLIWPPKRSTTWTKSWQAATTQGPRSIQVCFNWEKVKMSLFFLFKFHTVTVGHWSTFQVSNSSI